jgi:hypothetical protein
VIIRNDKGELLALSKKEKTDNGVEEMDAILVVV